MPHTLLLADDSVTIQRVIELTFADEDVAVVAVSDGDQAIARLESQPPDIVLADVGMPGKNGYEVAQYIKRTPRLSHIPVVLLTGAFEPVDQARAADAGCDGVLAKPFEPQLVIGRVKELLGRPRPGGTAAVAGAEPAPKPPQAAAPASEPPQPMPIHPPLRPEAPAAVPDAQELANYFDRLDAAFVNLPPAPAAPGARQGAPAVDRATESIGASATTPAPDEIDWFSAAASAGDTAPMPSVADQIAAAPPAEIEPEMPLSYASPETAFASASAESAQGRQDSAPADSASGQPQSASTGQGAPHAQEARAPTEVAAADGTSAGQAAPDVAETPAATAAASAHGASTWQESASAHSASAWQDPASAQSASAWQESAPAHGASPWQAAAPARSDAGGHAASERLPSTEAAARPTPATLPANPVALPPLADAFAALLAAERGETPSHVAWPATMAPPQPSADAIAEQITTRVLEQIGPRVDAAVRTSVADLVSQLAERLIRDEIERIKAAIK